MIRTVVCEKEGCSGNTFFIENDNENLKLICSNCNTTYELNMSYCDYKILSNCSKCNSKLFKVFRDTEKDGIYAKCIECGSLPEKIYIDAYGNQVSYEGKILNEIKELMYLLEQRIYGIEVKIEAFENSQAVLEESLAYINRYLVEKN